MLLKSKDRIIRVLEEREGQKLVVSCTQKSMPVWISERELQDYVPCEEVDLSSDIPDYEGLSPEQRRYAHERYTLIAGVIPFLGDKTFRCEAMERIASSRNISKQTIRHYLYRYLKYQNIAALAPPSKKQPDQLTRDEKNMRWAINKFYYTQHKNSLASAYTQMLKHKYCDASGILLPEYPSIHQFRYFYRKTRNWQTYYISREGMKSYQRNNRPLLGDGIQEFASSIGTGMLDSTICDVYLVNEAGELIGRPILTACVDAYSGLCCGYALSWEGGMYSLRGLMTNVIADKVAWCRQFGIHIEQEDWNCHQLPATLVTDMGSEYKSINFEQIAELGVTLINLPPYRPELKGAVEKFFDLVQSLYKNQLKGRGVIEPDYQERGAHDYRKDACLTMKDFETILLHCILYYNSKRIVENFPYTGHMLDVHVQPTASGIWNDALNQPEANLISVSYDALMHTLLPRTTGTFCRNGLIVNKLRYRNDDYTEMYLKGGKVTVAYSPDDVSMVWLIEDGIYTAFELIESRFLNTSIEEVDDVKSHQRDLISAAKEANTQAQIDLMSAIDVIAASAIRRTDTHVQNVRSTRQKERSRAHIDYMRDGEPCEG